MRQLLRRWCPFADDEVLFTLLRGHALTLLPKRGRSFLWARDTLTLDTLTKSLHVYFQQVGTFGDPYSQPFHRKPVNREEMILRYFSCSEPGHRANECPQKKNGSLAGKQSPEPMQTSAEKSKDSTVSCYTCGVEGHKIPQCPSKKTGKVTVKKIGSVAVKRCDTSHIVNGFINGKEVPVLLDSGAMITVVPEPFVA